MADTTDILGRLQAIEVKIEKIFGLIDELMRDQTESDKRIEKLEASHTRHKEALAEIFREQLFAINERLEKLEQGLKPPAEGSVK